MLIVRLLHGVTKHFPARQTEWMFSIILTLWGLVLLGDSDVFAGRSYAVLMGIAPEWVWAVGCLAVGLTRFMALVINGTFAERSYSRFSPHVRAVMSVLSCFFWFPIALSFVSGLSIGPPGTGLAVYPVILLFEFGCVWRAARDAAHADEAAGHARSR